MRRGSELNFQYMIILEILLIFPAKISDSLKQIANLLKQNVSEREKD